MVANNLVNISAARVANFKVESIADFFKGVVIGETHINKPKKFTSYINTSSTRKRGIEPYHFTGSISTSVGGRVTRNFR